ncbi:transient receptor potential channel pyrexia-like [Macrosteles quadrilineatus]|uniref:transient receptor potential channel pyrexia-like n=1 Tax=Macrosteles quadrilineatus TaxID=74068 RepID=UPI0023E15D77|nr:transient receptor potential channel pyrexia-like [Macrosteles quadrilineatus]
MTAYQSIIQYVFQWSQVMEICPIFSVFATSFIYTGRTYACQNYVGAFGVLCAWANVMLFIGHEPAFGLYVEMFTKVQRNFSKPLLAYALLIIGFTCSFCIIFPEEKTFRNPFTGFMTILLMMTGELDVSLLTGEGNVLHQISSHLILFLFSLLVTIMLLNLLVGIAVSDIQGLYKTAGISKLVRLTELMHFMEITLLQNCIFRKCIEWLGDETMKSYPRIYIRSMDPKENRLPKELITAAYRIARKQKKLKHNIFDQYSWDGNQLEEEVQNLKQLLQEQQQILKQSLQEHQQFVKQLLQEQQRSVRELLQEQKSVEQVPTSHTWA